MLSPFIHLFFLCSDVVLDLHCLLYSLLLFCLIKEDCSAEERKKKKQKKTKTREALDMKIVWPINLPVQNIWWTQSLKPKQICSPIHYVV